MNKQMNILIVGLGLIGGSYAKGLSEAGYNVNAIDINQKSVEFAIDKGWIVDGSTNVNNVWLKEADLIILGLYPNQILSWITRYQEHIKENCTLTDVSGVKTAIVYEIQSCLRNDIKFIASHPMAGKEVSGVMNSDNAIFHKANFIITPTKHNSEKEIEMVKQLASVLNFNRISILSVEEHDKMIAFLSQLTHVLAVVLMNTNDNEHLVDYTGDSFRDLTRIAKINENLWTELFLLNKSNLIKEIETFQAELNNFKLLLHNEDKDEMKKYFIKSTLRRKKFDK